MLEPVYLSLFQTTLPIPLHGRLIPAGFPSPADDYLEGEIDLSTFLIERTSSTFVMRVSGQSMTNAGILDGDFIIVDRSVKARHGQIVVATCNGEMTIKRLHILAKGRAVLRAEHPDFPEFVICEETPAEVWGVVVATFRKTL